MSEWMSHEVSNDVTCLWMSYKKVRITRKLRLASVAEGGGGRGLARVGGGGRVKEKKHKTALPALNGNSTRWFPSISRYIPITSTIPLARRAFSILTNYHWYVLLPLTLVCEDDTTMHQFHSFTTFHHRKYSLITVRRDSTVGIATRYWLDSPGIEPRWRRTFSAPVQTGSGAHPASYTMDTGSLSWG
jgi:hypothetical protein